MIIHLFGVCFFFKLLSLCISFFDLFTIPAWEKNEAFAGIMNQGHTILAYILIAAICLHVGAALYHHFVMKDDVLKRMLPGRKD